MAVAVLNTLARSVCLLITGAFLACGADQYPATGVVEDVSASEGQVVIAHEDIPGLMPAMTMSFDVPDRELAERLAPGQVIDFTVEFDGHAYRVVEARVTGEVVPEDGWTRLGANWVRTDPAPDFALLDQDGERVSLSDLAGKTVLLDFIFTECPGPCPILTAKHVAVQKKIPAALAADIEFVSISLDPRNDTPEAMKRYAAKHGADLRHWSFLTGPVEEVEPVVVSYGIGTARSEDGDIEHVVGTFLLAEDGRIAQRFLGLEHSSDEILAEILKLAAPDAKRD